MTAKSCPICGKPSAPAESGVAPFCSPRCKDVDLNRWLKGAYAIPAVEADGDDDDGAESETPGAVH